MKKIFFGLIILLSFLFFGYKIESYKIFTKSSPNSRTRAAIIGKISHNMKITSSVFENNQSIPSKYTCDGESINPPLQFSEVASNAKSLVLLMDDPDVPKNLKPDGVFDHWVVYNMPPDTKEITENSTPPGVQGLNGAGQNKYTGPCPPDREHRYFFKLYALDTLLDFTSAEKPDKKTIEQKMKGHILDQTELIGLYDRTKH